MRPSNEEVLEVKYTVKDIINAKKPLKPFSWKDRKI